MRRDSLLGACVGSPALRRRDATARNSILVGSQAGFTLLEITLVVLIISLMLTLVVPRFRDTGKVELRAQANRLQQVFRLMRSEAVLNGVSYRLNFDLDREQYWVTPGEGTDIADFARDFGGLGRGTRVESPAEIIDVDLPTLAGKVAQGQIYTEFYPDGTVDTTIIHLGAGTTSYTLYVNPMTGKLMLAEGYTNVTY